MQILLIINSLTKQTAKLLKKNQQKSKKTNFLHKRQKMSKKASNRTFL